VNQLWTIIFLSLAFWPVWAWYITRTFDKSDEPWGLVALATAVGILILGSRTKDETAAEGHHIRSDRSAPEAHGARNGRVASEALNIGSDGIAPAVHTTHSDETFPHAFTLNDPSYLAGAVFLSMYVITYPIAPHLVQAILLILTVWFFTVSRFASPSKTGVLGLLILSLPLIPSLNFFMGYPLRVVVAAGTCLMLNTIGMSTGREGVMLAVNGQLTAIDAPCSGISMLWAESYVVMLLACLFRLNLKYTSILSLVAFLFIVAGNIVRATTLIAFDKIASTGTIHNLSQLEPSVHLGAGLVVFCAACGLTIMVASALEVRMKQKSEARNNFFAQLVEGGLKLSSSRNKSFASLDFKFAHNQETAFMFLAKHAHIPASPARNVLLPLCLAAALTPLVAHPTSSIVASQMPPTWPTEINANKVIAVDSLAEERAFAQDFPGQMKRFTDGTNSYFVRFVQRETRQLHPSSDCFKGLGYRIEPHPIFVTRDGSRWGSFEAFKANSRYLIFERIYDNHGFSSTDVSEWYWLASLGKTQGPWFDVTIAQPLHP